MKLIRTLFLFILCVLAAYFFYFSQSKNSSYSNELNQLLKNSEVIFPSSIKNEINYLSFERPDSPTVRIRKDNEQWKIFQPVESVCDSFIISSVLSSLSFGKKQEKFKLEDSKDAYGFDKPSLKLIVGVDGVIKNKTLLIGKQLSFKDSYYAKWEDQSEVFTISQDLRSAIDKSLIRLRKRIIFKFSLNQVKSFRIAFDGRYFDIIREEGVWRFSEKSKFREEVIEPKDIEAYLSFLKTISVAQFYDDENWKDDQWGMKYRRDYVSISIDNEKPQILYMGYSSRELTGLYVHVHNFIPLGMIHSKFAERIKRTPESFLDRRVWKEDVGTVQRFEIKKDDNQWVFWKLLEHWESDDQVRLNKNEEQWAENLAALLFEMKYEDVQPRQVWEDFSPKSMMKIRLFNGLRKDESPQLELRIGEQDNQLLGYIQTSGLNESNDAKILSLDRKDLDIIMNIVKHLTYL